MLCRQIIQLLQLIMYGGNGDFWGSACQNFSEIFRTGVEQGAADNRLFGAVKRETHCPCSRLVFTGIKTFDHGHG